MTSIQKCPRCGADVLDGYCYSCGIELPPREPDEPQITNNSQAAYSEPQNVQHEQHTAYREQHTAYNGQQPHTAYSEPQTVYPNIKVTDDIVYEKPIQEDFFTKYNKMTFGDKFGKYWWFILLSILFPGFWLVPAFIGAASLLSYKKEKLRFILELGGLTLAGLLFFG